MQGLQNGIFANQTLPNALVWKCPGFAVPAGPTANPRLRFKKRTWGTLRVVVSCERVAFSGSIDG